MFIRNISTNFYESRIIPRSIGTSIQRLIFSLFRSFYIFFFFFKYVARFLIALYVKLFLAIYRIRYIKFEYTDNYDSRKTIIFITIRW